MHRARRSGPTSRNTKRRTSQGAVDTYGSKALSLFLKDYKRLRIEDACAATQGGLDVENLTVWANRTGKWEQVALPKQWKPTQSLCREVVTKVFGLSGEQYEAMRDVFDDRVSPDPMGIYQLTEDPSKFAIVLRLPQRDKYAALKIGGTVGAGVLVGVLGKMAHGSRKEQKEKWFEAYQKFLFNVQRLYDTLPKLETKLGITDLRPNLHFENPSDELKKIMFDWEYCQLFKTLDCEKALGLLVKGEVKNQALADKIRLLNTNRHLLEGPPELPDAKYYRILLTKPEYNQTFLEKTGSVQKQLVEMQKEVLRSATNIDEQYKIMLKNAKWIEQAPEYYEEEALGE
jgi:hypothetical protein